MVELQQYPNGQFAVVHTNTQIILRRYWDRSKAEKMTQILQNVAPVEQNLFSLQQIAKMREYLFEKMFLLFFVSGLSSVNKMIAFTQNNQSIGTTALKLNKGKSGYKWGIMPEGSFEYLLKLGMDSSYTGKLFVDSGAFHEINPDLTTRLELTKAQFDKAIDEIYQPLAEVWGERLYVVAPDKVADQDETLRRLNRHKSQLEKLGKTGCNIIGVVQKSPTRSMYDFHELLNEFFQSIGIPEWVRGLPLNKSPVKPDDVADMLRKAKPFKSLHLLGKSPYAKDYDTWEKVIVEHPYLDITSDTALERNLTAPKKELYIVEKGLAKTLREIGEIDEQRSKQIERFFQDQFEFDYTEAEPIFDNEEIKQSLAQTLEDKVAEFDFPDGWLLKNDNLYRIAYLNMDTSYPYDLEETAKSMGLYEQLTNAEDDSEEYWNTLLDVYDEYRYQKSGTLDYYTFGSHMVNRRDAYSAYGELYLLALKADQMLSEINKYGSLRPVAMRYVPEEARGFPKGKIVRNPKNTSSLFLGRKNV